MSRARSNPASRARASFDDALVARIAVRHADGSWLKHACAIEGATYEGLRDACAREPRWAAIIAKAHAEGAETMRRRILDASVDVHGEQPVRTGDWKRDAWMLERWDRDLFHLATKVEAKTELTGANGGGIQIVVGSLEELRRLAANTEDE